MTKYDVTTTRCAECDEDIDDVGTAGPASGLVQYAGKSKCKKTT